MCGIAGCYQQPDGHKLADVMTERIAHRGPDAGGVWSHEDDRVSVHLGHRRLSIIDLSAAADQPMIKDNLVMVYNGELYNYRELREELAGRGVRFTTNSDTEVVVEAWRHWGPKALQKFRGMFAFALADTKTGELFLARDPLGIKPLFYLQRGRRRAVRLRAEGADRRGRPGAADRAGRAGRVDALLLGARAVLRDRGRAQAPGRLLGPAAARTATSRSSSTGTSPTWPATQPTDQRPTSARSSRSRSPPTWSRTCRCPASCPAAWTPASSPCWRTAPRRRSTPTRSRSGPRTSGWRPCPTTRSTPARSRRSTA